MENPLRVIPVNLGVKYSPPKIGLEYHMPGQPAIQYIYEIPLVQFVEQHLNSDLITEQIFREHKDYLHPRVIARSQIQRLLDRVLARQRAINEKENSNKQNQRRSMVDDRNQPAPPTISSHQNDHNQMGNSQKNQNAILLEDGPVSERSDLISNNSVQELSAHDMINNGQQHSDDKHHHNNMSGQFQDFKQHEKHLNNNSVVINEDFHSNEQYQSQNQQDLSYSEVHQTNLAAQSPQIPEDDLSGGISMDDPTSTSNKQQMNNFQNNNNSQSRDHHDNSNQHNTGDEADDQFPGATESQMLIGMESGNDSEVMNEFDEGASNSQVQLGDDDIEGVDQEMEGMQQENDSAVSGGVVADDMLGPVAGIEDADEEDDDDAIDITDPEALARRGLQRIQIESEQEEYLLDQEGNIYNLQGEFVGTIDNEGHISEVEADAEPVEEQN